MDKNDSMTPLCGAKSRSSGGAPCRRFAGPSGRCSNHGGKSTGPKTQSGKERQQISVLKHGFWTKESIAKRKQIKKALLELKNYNNTNDF